MQRQNKNQKFEKAFNNLHLEIYLINKIIKLCKNTF
jgi:hypothetical protein